MKNVIYSLLYSSGMGSSQSSFVSYVHSFLISILALTVYGPANPRGSYILVTWDKIICLVNTVGIIYLTLK